MPQTANSKGLSAREKSMIVFVVLAVLAAGGFIYATWRSQQPQILDVKVQPPGSSAKLQAMKAMKEGQGANNLGAGGAGQDVPGTGGKSTGSGQ